MIAMRFFTLILLMFTYSYIVPGEAITIHNHTLHPVYAAAYKVGKTLCGESIGPAERQSLITKIAAQGNETVDRPAFHLLRNRELCLSIRQHDLKEGLTPEEYIETVKFPIGRLDSSTCHIAEDENTLKGYSPLNWHIFEPIFAETHKATHAIMRSLRQEYNTYPYAKTDAHVLYDASLSQEERSAVTNRRARACKRIARITGIPVTQDNVPCSVVCASGGGMRAALCAYGFTEGLKKTKLLRTITHYIALSGSTWFLNDWLSYNGPKNQYHEHFMQALTQAHLFPPTAVTRQLLRKSIFGQDTSIVDLYSVFLAHTFFSQEKDPEAKHLSTIVQKVKRGGYPFPLCTALEASADHHWLEFTPYDVRSGTLNFRLPTWAFGRKFVNGTSIDKAPELPLGFFMGMCGSALSGNLEEIYQIMSTSHDNPVIQRAIQAIIQDTGLAEVQPAAIHIHNPLYGIDASPHRNIKQFVVMDAGYSCNIPLPPALERNADIIYILDASENVCANHDELKKAEALAHQQGKLFPPIDYDKIGNNPVTIFTDPQNPRCPAVVYIFPTKNDLYDPGFDPSQVFTTTYQTARFIYTRPDAEKLAGLIQSIIVAHQKELHELIKQKTMQVQQFERLTRPPNLITADACSKNMHQR